MSLLGRYYSQTDLNFINSVNGELMGDIVENLATIYKIAPNETKTNIYGETSPETGKWYLPAIQISVLVDRPEMETQQDDFGPSRNQNHVFKMREKMCTQLNFYPEIGDMVYWNNRYYEIDNVVQEQLLGGQQEKSHSIICNSHYTQVTSLNIMPRNN
jgi:hypothetical protein